MARPLAPAPILARAARAKAESALSAMTDSRDQWAAASGRFETELSHVRAELATSDPGAAYREEAAEAREGEEAARVELAAALKASGTVRDNVARRLAEYGARNRDTAATPGASPAYRATFEARAAAFLWSAALLASESDLGPIRSAWGEQCRKASEAAFEEATGARIEADKAPDVRAAALRSSLATELRALARGAVDAAEDGAGPLRMAEAAGLYRAGAVVAETLAPDVGRDLESWATFYTGQAAEDAADPESVDVARIRRKLAGELTAWAGGIRLSAEDATGAELALASAKTAGALAAAARVAPDAKSKARPSEDAERHESDARAYLSDPLATVGRGVADLSADLAALREELAPLTQAEHNGRRPGELARFTYRVAHASAPASAITSGSGRVRGDSLSAAVRYAMTAAGVTAEAETSDPTLARFYRGGRPVFLTISPAAEQFAQAE